LVTWRAVVVAFFAFLLAARAVFFTAPTTFFATERFERRAAFLRLDRLDFFWRDAADFFRLDVLLRFVVAGFAPWDFFPLGFRAAIWLDSP
jgi:hypothetical protein